LEDEAKTYSFKEGDKKEGSFLEGKGNCWKGVVWWIADHI
jgi:hypothetical protein